MKAETKRRVVITGMGAVSPNGIGNTAFGSAILAGRSGVRRISRFDASEIPVQIAGEICDFDELNWVDKRDRKHLSEDGVLVPIIAIDKHTGRVDISPEIVTRGMFSDNGQELMAGAREVVLKTVEQSNPEEKTDWGVMKEKIRLDLKRYINKHTSKRPLILPVILEV